MKILISDKMSDKVEDVLKSKSIDYDIKTGMEPEELKSVIDEYDGILIRSATKLTSDILADCTNLKVVGRAGVGVDNVDLDTATKNKILVMNTPLGNLEATAELTIGLMFSLVFTPFLRFLENLISRFCVCVCVRVCMCVCEATVLL